MDDTKLTVRENIYGLKLVAKTYAELKKLAEEQIEKEADLTEAALDDVIVSFAITKLLVAEGKLDEKYWRSAIS